MNWFDQSRRDPVRFRIANSTANSLVCIFSVLLPFATHPSVQAKSFGQPRDQPHVNAPVEQRVTWNLFRAMPNHLKRTIPSNVRHLRSACSGWGGVKLQAGENVDGTVICGKDQQSTVSYEAYRNFGTDYVSASILVSLHTAIQVDPERRSQLISDFQQPKTLQNLVDRGLNHAMRIGSPLVQSSREILSQEVTKTVVAALRDPNWERSLYGSVGDYEVLSQSFCNAQGLDQKQAQIAASRLKGYQLYATCWMESGLPSDLIRDYRISKHLKSPQSVPATPIVPTAPIAPIDSNSSNASRVTPKSVSPAKP